MTDFKIYLRMVMLAVLSLIILSCTAEKKKYEAPEPDHSAESIKDVGSKPQNCLVGKWSYIQDGRELIMLFRDDNTGVESLDDGNPKQKFTWKNDGDVVVIVYQGNTHEIQYKFNCVLQELIVRGLIYSKS